MHFQGSKVAIKMTFLMGRENGGHCLNVESVNSPLPGSEAVL